MLLKLLGIIDVIAGITLFILKFGVGKNFALVLGIILLIKGLIFITSIISVADLIAGLLLILSAYGYFYTVYLIFALWLLQKGFLSMYS